MANFIKRTGATALDIFGNVLTGALKSVEGVVDMGLGVTGAIGGIFNEDFKKDMQKRVEYDFVGENIGKPLDKLTKDSYTNDGKVGQMIEGVASGLGQMLPTIVLTAVTGGAAAGLGATAKGVSAAKTAASLGTLWASAAGNATEEAYKDGADYEKGMLYGAASGAVEAGTEKLFGGVTKNIIGGGILDDVGKSIVGEIGEVGLKRVAKDALGEGIEEIAAEVANPALKAIYKGKGAFAEYGDKEYWQGVGEAGIIGAGTSLAYGGTVGKIAKTSGKYADVASSLEAVSNINKAVADIDAEGKLTADIESDAANAILTNYEQVETVLKSVNEKTRADIIKRNNLSGVFDTDGSLLESVGAELDRRISKADRGMRGEYYTANARGKEDTIREDLAKISAKLNAGQSITASREGAGAPTSAVRVFSGELSDTGRESLTKTKKALRALNKKGGADVSLIITEDIPGINGVMVGDHMYITRAALESGKYIGTLVHEYTHFEEGTREYARLAELYQSDRKAFLKAVQDVIDSGYGITDSDLLNMINKLERGEKLTDEELRKKQTLISEANAKMTEAILGNEQFINKLVREDASLAAKIIDKIKSLIEMLKNIGNSAAMAEHRRLVEAEKLYLKAAEAAGNRELIAKILEKKAEDEKAETNTEDSNPDQNDKKTPLTNTDSGNMSVSEDVQFSFGVTQEDINNYIENAYKNNNTEPLKEYSAVAKRLIDDTKFYGLDIKGYTHALRDNDIRHIRNSHGENTNEKYPVTRDDLSKIPDIVSNYDKVFVKTNANGVPGIVYVKVGKENITYYVEAVTEEYKKKKLLVNKQMIKTGSNDIPNLYGLKDAINKKESSSQYLADLDKIRKAYVQDVKENYSKDSIPDFSEKVNTSNEKIQFSREVSDVNPANARKKNPSIADIERRKAEFEKLRVYEKADAEIIINNILSSVLPADENVFSQLENKTRKQAENILYDTLNRASTDAEKTKAASDLADYIIMHSVVKDYVNEQEKSAMRQDYQTVIAYLGGLRNALNLDGIKDEIKHRFDDKAGGVYMQWAAKAGTKGRFTVDSIIEDINSVLSGLPGFPIEAVNEAEIFFGLYDAYQNAKEGLKKESTAYLDKYITPDERKKLKRDIVNSILESRKTLGRESALSKVMREYNRRMREANGEVERMKQINKLIFQVDELKNMSIGRFVNANTYRTDLFDTAIAELKKITRGGNISVAGIRTAASHLVQWYNKSNPLIGESGFDSAVFDALSRIADNNLTDEKGNVIKIQEILEQYKKNLDLSNVLDKKGRRIPKNSIWRAAEENKNPITLKEVAKQLRAKGIVIEGDDSAIFDYIQTAYKDPARPLTTEDFRDLTDVVAYFRKYITNFKKVYRNGKYEEALPIARNYVDIMEKNESVRVGWLTKLGKGGYAQHFFRPQSIAKIMDGYEKGFYTDMLGEFRRGSIQAADYEYEMQRDIEPFYKKNKKYFKSLSDRTVRYDGKEIPVNIAMSLYMTSKREQARAGLGASGFQFELNREKVAKFSGCNNTGTIEGLINGVSNMQKALYDQFSNTDKAFIELAENIFNTRCKELKYKTDIETKGYSNTVDGYYYPIRRAFVAKSIDSDFEDLMGRASNKSFNKDTVKGAKGVLCIMPLTDMLSRHVKGVAQYAALANVVRNYDTLYNLSLNENANDPVSVHSVGQKTWIGGEDYMKQLLSDVQGIGQKKSPVLSGIMGGYATYQLGANPKTWLSQMSSLFAATSVLDFDCVMRGITVTSSDVDKYSSIAKIRNANNDAVLAQANANKSSLLGKENKVTGSLKDFGELLMKPISVMDRFVVKRLFGACQLQVANNGGAKVGTEANKKAAAELLETVIISTQQNAYATERSAAMRGGEISRMLTMFSADGMNVIGQAIDGLGEYCTLKRKIRLETDTKRRAELQERLKLAGKKTRKSFFALFSSAAFMGAIAILFHKFYGRELEDDETYLDFFAANSIGNIFGGLPLIRDAYTYFVDGYEVEGYLFSTLNETFAGMKEVAELSTQLVSGKPVNQRDIANGVRKVLYSSGQIVGVPVRNIYNSTRGVLGLLNGSAAYTVDDLFYKQSYNKDLAKAIEKGDDDLVSTILGIVTGERIGAVEDDKSRETLNRLTVKGYDVLPRAVGDTLSYNGTEYELSAKEQSKFKSIYAEAHTALAELVKLPAFTKADEETQADAIKHLYNVYYEIARNETLDTEETKTTLFARVLDAEELALVIAHASNLKADKDKAGNSISGSKKRKVQKYVEGLKITAAEKYLIMGYLGYKNLYGKDKVTAYLNRYKLTKSEKEQILKACGY